MEEEYTILLNATENYIPYVAVLMTSIIQNTKLECENLPYSSLPLEHHIYSFHIIGDSFSTEINQKLSRLESELSLIYPCKIKTHHSNFNHESLPTLNGNYTTYYRLFFEKFLPKECKKALYLDVDMLTLWDIREIFSFNLEGKVCGVVLDYFNPNRLLKAKNQNIKTKNISQQYFNSGLLLINVQQWREQNIETQIINALELYHYNCHDQDILNHILQDKIEILPPEWNLLVYCFVNARTFDNVDKKKKFNISYPQEKLKKALKSPKILHYYLDNKPWRDDKIYLDSNGEFLGKHWWNVAEKTPVFSKELIDSKSLANKKDFQVLLGYLLLTLVNFRFYLAYKIFSALQRGSTTTREIPKEKYNLCFEIGKSFIKDMQKSKTRIFLFPLRIITLSARLKHARSNAI